ncbi:2-polyprenyl-6-methoxyphenol hydroxylase [Pseudomonas sp. 8BK]|uniref:FAD-dependent monooxygenase n=1 Tax=Pseudomonas sp. 8BK TaxID=2653164 RepID=UPI0012EFE15D|nr:FAD-dependent monooxygenase [Pseudomonas sp. 8BK]VXB94698.1 2-polyprenyl-6-methoxyphenol hydroxylase [Pseudomonas sp. 8BK]
MKPHVLIVGGGPTGMTLALQLQRFGIGFRLIEKRPKQASGSKALSINPASLNLLDDLGVADSLIEMGHKTEVINLVYDNQTLMRARFASLPSKFPFFLMLPQPETEAVLEQRLSHLGHEIERECELIGLRQFDGHVEAELRTSKGLERQRFNYVVGCDGGLSKVRSELGLDFSGYDYNMHFILADLRIQWPGAKEQGFYFIRDDGFLILLPLKDGFHRIVIKVNEQCPPGYKPSLEEIRGYIERYEISGLQVSDPIWLSSAPFYNRSASTIRRGRVFLAGDAAHLFSPIGGFGMNSGIADAFNLGWKLGYSLKGLGNDHLLQSYADEREQTTRTLLAKTDKSTSLIARLHRHLPAEEQAYLPRLCNRGFIRRFPLETAGLTLRYGTPLHELQAGCQLPYVATLAQLPQALGQAKHSLLMVPSSETNPAAVKRLLALLEPLRAHLRIHWLGEHSQGLPAANHLADPQQRLRQAWQLGEGEFLLVRPDLFIDCRGRLDDPSSLTNLIERFYLHDLVTAEQLAG